MRGGDLLRMLTAALLATFLAGCVVALLLRRAAVAAAAVDPLPLPALERSE